MSCKSCGSRRRFLKQAAFLGAGAVTWGVMPQMSHAAANLGNGTRVLFLNLNGGLDGLYALQPGSGAIYSALSGLRPTLTVDPATLLSAKYGFGFNPKLPLFKSLFDAGDLSAVLGVGYENMSRSHLDSETVIARGVPDRLTAASSGFLNRLGAYYGWDSLNAVSVTGTDLAFEGGDFRGMQVGSLQSYYFRGFDSAQERNHLRDSAFANAEDADTPDGKPLIKDFAKNFSLAVNTTDIVRDAVNNHAPAMSYPSTQYGRALKDIDTLFSTPDIHTQIGYMRASGFDTHSNQASTLDRMLQELDAALTVFVNSMKSKSLWNNLIILVYSEFGRTNRENGSVGTDHGGANSVFLLGGAVQGGEIFGEMSANDLTGFGWLQMKFNIVEVYRRIVAKLGLDPDVVFAPNTGASLPSLF